MFKFPKISTKAIEVLFIFLVGLTPLLWYKQSLFSLENKPGYLAAGHDMSYPLAPLDHFLDRLFTWTNRIGAFGSNQTDSLNGVFIHGFEGLLDAFGFSLVHTQQITYIFWFVLPGLTMYVLLRSLYPEKKYYTIRIVGSLVYMMNLYLLQAWVIAERTKFSVVAAIPLAILILINVFYRKQGIIKNAILFSLTTTFLNGGAGIPLWGGFVLAILSFLAVLIFASGGNVIAKIKRLVAFFGLLAIFSLALNAYWIVPYFESFSTNYTDRVGSSGGGEGAVAWSAEISKNTSFTNLLKLQGIPDMYGNPEHPYAQTFLQNPFFIAISIFFPIVIFANFLFIKKHDRRHLVYLIGAFAVLIISLPFVAGSHPPFGILYDLLLKYLPGFSIFRTPIYKFGMALWFAYSYLFAVGIYYLSQNLKQRIPSKTFPIQATVLILVLFILGIYNYPYFTGVFFNWSKKYSTMIQVPDYIFQAKSEIDANKFSTRTLVVPGLNPDNKYESYDWKYFSLSSIPSILTRRSVVLNDAYLKGLEVNIANGVYSQLETNGNSRLLTTTGADSIIVRNDFYGSNEDAVHDAKEIKSIKNDPNYVLRKTLGQWDIYDIKTVQPIPLIVSPNKMNYLISSPDFIRYASELPGFSINEPYLYKNLDNRKSISDALPYVSQIVAQSVCVNCAPGRTLFSIQAVNPRIYPGTKLYVVAKYFENRQKDSISDPSQKIDFILGNITKRLAVLETQLKDHPRNDLLINTLLSEWKDSLNEIDNIYSGMNDEIVQEQNANKIYFYARQFLLTTQKWIERDHENNSYYQVQLADYTKFLRNYISDSELSKKITQQNSLQRKFIVDIPKNGSYKIFIKPNLTTLKNGLNVKVNDIAYFLPLTEKQGDWLETPTLDLNAGAVPIILPDQSSDYTPVLAHPDFSIVTNNFQVSCQDISLNNVDTGGVYKVKFNYEGTSRSYLNFTVQEKGKYDYKIPDDHEITSSRLIDDKGLSNVEGTFGVSSGTNLLVFHICLDPYDASSSTLNIKNFDVEIIPYIPQIFAVSQEPPLYYNPLEFVALNQSKYLVRFTGESDTGLLRFNSRYDSNWKIREVSAEAAGKYFQGETKDYSNTNVKEFERQDSHILTDLVFPKYGSNSPKLISLNNITNTWKLENVRGRVYLLEYDIQNDFYKSAAVSIASLITLLVIYLVIKRYEK